MKKAGVFGDVRLLNDKVERDVRKLVRQIFQEGNGIVLQGKLGVDLIALEESFLIDPWAKRSKVNLPIPFKEYIKYYREGIRNGKISVREAGKLISLLHLIRDANPDAVIENLEFKKVDYNSVNERILKILGEIDIGFIFTFQSDLLVKLVVENANKLNLRINEKIYTIP